MTTSLRDLPRRLGAVLLVLGMVLAGCGINMDHTPRTVEAQLSTTTTLADQAQGGVEGVLYYVAEGAIVPATTLLSDRSAKTLIEALLKAPPKPLSEVGAYSSIPAGTTLIASKLRGSRLVVNLSQAFDNVVGVSRQQAIAQIVLTVTQQAAVRSVEFQVNGEDIQVTSPIRGDRSEVSNCDFRDLLATTDQGVSAGLSDDSIALLKARRARLKMIC
ncbi:MAG: GerMN domain-containing protein [Microthrixaceae bacterium]